MGGGSGADRRGCAASVRPPWLPCNAGPRDRQRRRAKRRLDLQLLPDKDELLQHILDQNQARFERSIIEARADIERETAVHGGSDPVRVFMAVYRHYVEYIEEVRQFARLAYREIKSLSREGRAPILERDRRVRRLLAEAAEPGINAGLFYPEGLELKILSLEMLAHTWVLRAWALPYSNVQEYFADLEPIALAILTAIPAKH